MGGEEGATAAALLRAASFVLTLLRSFTSLQAATDWEDAAESGRVEPAEVRCGTAEGWHGKLAAPS